MSSIVKKLTSKSSYAEVVAFENCRFKHFSMQDVDNIKAQFKKWDANGDENLNYLEVGKLYEALGEPKTITQIRQIISEIDLDKDGEVSFFEFLVIFSGQPKKLPQEKKDGSGSTPQLQRAFKNTLIGKFEDIAAAKKDNTDERIADIKAQYQVRKTELETKKAAAEIERQRQEEEERKKQEGKARLAARAAMFQSAQ